MKLLKHGVHFHYEQRYWPNGTNLNDLLSKSPNCKNLHLLFRVVAHSIIQGNMLIDFCEQVFVGYYFFKKPTIVFDTQCVSAEYNGIFLLKKCP